MKKHILTILVLSVFMSQAYAGKKYENPLRKNERLKELYIELVTIDTAMGFEKITYSAFALINTAETRNEIRIVSSEKIMNRLAEKHPGIFANKKGYRCSGDEYGLNYKIDFGDNKTKRYCKNFSTWEMSSELWKATAGFSWRNSEIRGGAYAFPVLWSKPTEKTDNYVCVRTYATGQRFSSRIQIVESSVFQNYLSAASAWLTPGKVKADKLLAVLRKGNSGEKGFAIRMLGRKKAKETVSVIEKFLRNKDYYLREAAFKSLGMMGGRKAIAALREIMSEKDKRYNYQIKAIEALGMMKTKKTLPVLEKLLEDDNGYLRARAVNAIGESKGGEKAIKTLIPYFSDKDINVRHAVIDSLHKLGWRAK